MHIQHIHHHRHHHGSHYTVLLLMIATGFFSFLKLTGEPVRQMQVVAVTGLAYVTWGIFHHLSARDLNWKVVVEYSSIAFLAIGLLWVLLLPVS